MPTMRPVQSTSKLTLSPAGTVRAMSASNKPRVGRFDFRIALEVQFRAHAMYHQWTAICPGSGTGTVRCFVLAARGGRAAVDVASGVAHGVSLPHRWHRSPRQRQLASATRQAGHAWRGPARARLRGRVRAARVPTPRTRAASCASAPDCRPRRCQPLHLATRYAFPRRLSEDAWRVPPRS